MTLVASLMTVMGLFGAGAASAAVFTVNSTGQQADATPGNGVCATAQATCTLRAALEETNALIGADVINVPAGDYPVTTWAPVISQSLVLRGTAGAALTRLDSGGTGQRWSISGGGIVEVEGLTFTGVNGGFAAVTVNGPDTTFRDVSIEDNRSTGSGGGGMRIQTAQVTMIRSAVTDNLVDTTSSQVVGGGIALYENSSLTAVATTIARNVAKTTQSTGFGGGIYSNGQLIMRHVTLRANSIVSSSAANYGGNLFLSMNSQTSIRDSISVDGLSSSGQSRNCGNNSAVPLTVTGNNIYEPLGSNSCVFAPGSIADTSTALTPLGDYGGTGLTSVPLPGSSAVDGASGCPDGGLDQRGAKAPAGAACDIGAAELGADLRMQLTAAPGPVAPGAAVFHTAVLSNAGLDAATAARLTLTPTSGLSILSVNGGSCTATGQCSFGTLTPGMSATVTFSVDAPANGSLTTTASGAADSPDPSPEDAIATATTEVAGSSVLKPPVVTRLRAIGKLRSGKPGRIGLVLSREATVRIVVSRLINGRRSKGNCRANATKGKRCQVAKRVGVLTAKRKAGAAVVPLPRRLGGRKLAPGRYRLDATATSPDGLRSKVARANVKVQKAPARKRPR